MLCGFCVCALNGHGCWCRELRVPRLKLCAAVGRDKSVLRIVHIYKCTHAYSSVEMRQCVLKMKMSENDCVEKSIELKRFPLRLSRNAQTFLSVMLLWYALRAGSLSERADLSLAGIRPKSARERARAHGLNSCKVPAYP